MSRTAQVLVLDDGELDDVYELLCQLVSRVTRLRGGEIPDSVEPPARLLVTTTRRASLSQDWVYGPSDPDRPSKICIVDEDSNTLRAMLRRIGFDLLIRRPVHPYALRLVLLRSLYRGQERRSDERVAIGHRISVRSGLRRRAVVLADLSLRGCRLLSSHPHPVGSCLTLQIPRELTGDKPLPLRARVLRTTPRTGEGERGHTMAMAFDNLTAATKRRITQILKDMEHGPSKFSGAVSDASKRAPREKTPSDGLPAAAPASEMDRRKDRRVKYERELVTLGEQAVSTLIGRDLSVGGMQVEADSGLAEGDVLRLALYGAAREEPFIVKARVVRDAGDRGFGLRFEDLAPGLATRLESLVAGLPTVEALQDGECDAMGSIVSEILERT